LLCIQLPGPLIVFAIDPVDGWEGTLMVNGSTERVQAGGSSAPHLLIVAPDGTWSSKPLPTRGVLIIGRDDEVDVRVDERAVSRKHARLEAVGPGNLRLVDLRSANGTLVGGQLVRDASVVVRSGEPILIGRTVLSVHGLPPARTPESARQPRQSGHAMSEIDKLVAKAAPTLMSVLLLGETGVGKGVTAHRIHSLSTRSKGPLMQLNCAALSTDLLESHLFGHVRGAFTGATQTKQGLLEVAAGGTVFLDEIGEMPLDVQAKLLVAIEDHVISRVGANLSTPIDVRFICATNRDLEVEVRHGRFRKDFYYRINEFPISIPPLRERRDEIDGLVLQFACDLAKRLNRDQPPVFHEDALAALNRYDWPGNIRELRTIVQRAIVLADENTVTPHVLAAARLHTDALPPPGGGAEDAERERVRAALLENYWNQTRTAEQLGIPRNKLIWLIQRYNLPRPRPKRDPDHPLPKSGPGDLL